MQSIKAIIEDLFESETSSQRIDDSDDNETIHNIVDDMIDQLKSINLGSKKRNEFFKKMLLKKIEGIK